RSLGRLVAACERDVENRSFAAKRELIGRALQAHHLYVAKRPDTEERSELSLKVKLRERRELAEALERQGLMLEMRIDVAKDVAEARHIGDGQGGIGHS